MSDTSPTARAGINLLGFKIPTELGYIFRELPTDDYGIDGEIETRDDASRPTGRLVAAQVKSGPSYLNEERDDHFVYRGSLDHLQYWTKHSLPVIVILVDVDAKVAYWTPVDDTVVRTDKGWKIAVPKSRRIDASAKAPLRELANALAMEAQKRARADFKSIRDRFLSGERAAALEALTALIKQPSWRFADGGLHAEAFRSLALWLLLLRHGREEMEAYLKKARDFEATSDEGVVRATLALIDGDNAAALTALDESTSAPAANLRVAILLNDGRIKDAQRELRERPPSIERNTETTRLEAMMALIDGDLTCATERIEAATADKPGWIAVRESRAVIDYFSALPPSEAEQARYPFPAPMPLALVRHDDASLKRLRRAAKEFALLADIVEGDDEKRRYRLWQAAALANDPDAQAAASEVVCAEFERSSPLGPLVMLGLERGYLPEADAVLDRLKNELAATVGIDAAERDPNIVATTLRILLASSRVAEARTLLDENEKTLSAHDPDAALYWDARVSVGKGDAERARSFAARIDNLSMRGEAEAFIANRTSPEDWKSAAEAFASEYATTGDVAALYSAVRLRQAHGDSEFVLSVAEDLFQAVPNLEVLQRIAESAWRTGRFRACLDWIEKWRAISSTETEGLLQTRVACLVHVDPLTAAREADELLRKYPTVENVSHAMLAFLRIGDLKALSLAARRLLTAADAHGAALLHATQMTLVDDPELARELLRTALNGAIEDDDVGTAFLLAHQLGQDHETAPLIARMQQLAAEGRGGVEAKRVPESFPELLKMASSHQERVADVLAKFQAAEAPVHAVARTLGWTLAEIFHLWPRENAREDAIVRHRPLLVRHGGIPEREVALEGKTLSIDITALLLAAEIDLLDVLETVYRPIRISRLLPAALFEQQRRLGDTQPSRLAGFERLLKLVEAKKLASVGSPRTVAPASYDDRLLDHFVAFAPSDAVLVELLPIRDANFEVVRLDDELATRVIGLGDFLQRAREEAILDAEMFEAAMIGVPRSASTPLPELPASVVLSPVAASMLSSSDALTQLADGTTLAVPHWVIDEARASVAWAAKQNEVRTWVDSIRERVRRGLESGVYVTTVGEGEISSDDIRDLEIETLSDLVQAPMGENDIIWIEDRLCSRLGPAVVGVFDILRDLRRRSKIKTPRYASVLQHLRTGDVRYLPITRDDLVAYIADARGRDLPDTRELQTISRTLAAYALDPNRINTSLTKPGPHEIAILLTINGVTASTLPSVWSTHRNDHARAARHAAWLTTYVYFGRVTVRASTEPDAGLEVVKDDLAHDVARLYLGALITAANERPKQWETSATAAYIDWVTNTFAHRQLFADADMVALTGKHLAAYAASYTAGLMKKPEIEAADGLLVAVFVLLPDDLRKAWMTADPSFQQKHGIVVTDQVNLGGLVIPARPFWAAMERAVAAKHPPKRAKVRVSIESTGSNEALVVTFDGATQRLEDPLFARFARGDAEECAGWAAAHPDYFDMPVDRRYARGMEIGGLPTARARVAAADEQRNKSAIVFYGRLAEQLTKGGRLPETAFQLAPGALRDHLRWTDAGIVDADALAADVGPEEALRRLVTLPIALPKPVVDEVAAAGDAVGIIERLLDETASPLSLMHAIALALRVMDRIPKDLAPAVAVSAERGATLLLAEAYEERFATLERAYAAVSAWFSHDTDGKMLPPRDRLLFALSHACRLLNVMGPGRMAKAADFFRRVVTLPREVLSRDRPLVDHELHPTNLSYERFVVLGLCGLLSDVAPDALGATQIPSMIRDALIRLRDAGRIGAFFMDASLRYGAEQTIYSEESSEVVRRIVGTVPIPLPSTAELRKVTGELLAQAQKDITSGWYTPFASVVGNHRVHDEHVEDLNAITAAFADSATRSRLDDRALVTCAAILATQAAAADDVTWRERVRRAVIEIAREFDSGQRDVSILGEIGPAFIEVALALAARQADPASSARELAGEIDELVRAWPSLAYAVAAQLSDFVWTAPADQALPLWRVLLRARENSFKN